MAESSAVKSVSEQIENNHIIYDAQLTGQISLQWFDAEFWRTNAQVQAVSGGRGQAWFIHHDGRDYVLRHYRRGGVMAKFTADRYVWNGLSRTRAWREFHLLLTLKRLGLPAPSPLAARVQRQGILYTADLLISRIPDSIALSQILTLHALDTSQWQAVGRCIRRFHHHDIRHADLNAHNILLDKQGSIYLIDFDKGDVDQDHSWQAGTLERLQRSLIKLKGQQSGFHFAESDWQALLAGYQT